MLHPYFKEIGMLHPYFREIGMLHPYFKEIGRFKEKQLKFIFIWGGEGSVTFFTLGPDPPPK